MAVQAFITAHGFEEARLPAAAKPVTVTVNIRVLALGAEITSSPSPTVI